MARYDPPPLDLIHGIQKGVHQADHKADLSRNSFFLGLSNARSGTVAENANHTEVIQFPVARRAYMIHAGLYAANVEVMWTAIVHVPNNSVNVGWAVIASHSYSNGLINPSTQSGGAQFAFNTSSNRILQLGFVNGPPGSGTGQWFWYYKIV